MSPSSANARRLDPALLETARRALRRRDPILGEVIRKVGPCRLKRRRDPYVQLARSVLFQQLAGSAARAIEVRLQADFGGRYPRPAQLLAAPHAKLRKAGLSRQKIAALRDIARAFEEGTVTSRRLQRMDDQGVIDAVTEIRGVGEWTAHMLLMFCLGRPDVLPVGDYGVRKSGQMLYGLPGLPTPRQLEELAEPWRPYRTVASWYLWRAADVRPPEGASR